MKGRPFHERFGFAVEGLKAGWGREASFRTQICIAGAAGLMLLILHPRPIWWAIVILVVAVILALELLNSAIEAAVDLLHPAIHPEIKAIKDMVAGAVLTISIAALGIGLALLIDRGPELLEAWSK